MKVDYRTTVTINGMAQSMRHWERPTMRSVNGRVEFRLIEPAAYGIAGTHQRRRCSLLLHQPRRAWTIWVDGDCVGVSAWWWCGKLPTTAIFSDDPAAPNTTICVGCVEARAAVARKAKAVEIIRLLRSGALTAPF